MRREVADTGEVTYYFRQSWLNDWFKCPTRAVWNDMLDDSPPSTASAIGTAMHAGIAVTLGGGTQREVVSAMSDAWAEESHHPRFRREDNESDLESIRMAGHCYKAWEKNIAPTLKLDRVESIEHEFEVVVDERFDPDNGLQRIVLKGTWDAMIDGVIWDWKTGSNPAYYYDSEVERAIQPSCYTLAAYRLGLVDIVPALFKYGIVYKRKRMACPTDIKTTGRDVHAWTWLTELMWDVVDTYDHPPLNPMGWWCSPKWCEHYSVCRGRPRVVPDLWSKVDGAVGVPLSAD